MVGRPIRICPAQAYTSGYPASQLANRSMLENQWNRVLEARMQYPQLETFRHATPPERNSCRLFRLLTSPSLIIDGTISLI
ncbi:hypothetical protein BDW72DRAFT_185934 [Aspergillus terricola var. indicus]